MLVRVAHQCKLWPCKIDNLLMEPISKFLAMKHPQALNGS